MPFTLKMIFTVSSLLFVGCSYFLNPVTARAKSVESKIAVTATVDSSISFLMDKTELLNNPTVAVSTNEDNGLGILADDTVTSKISQSSLDYPVTQDQMKYKIIARTDKPINRGEVSLSASDSDQGSKEITIVCTGNF